MRRGVSSQSDTVAQWQHAAGSQDLGYLLTSALNGSKLANKGLKPSLIWNIFPPVRLTVDKLKMLDLNFSHAFQCFKLF